MKERKVLKIFGYFVLYSFLGYLIETIFCIVTTGVWQCRQSFLYGPFCGIYGIGAVMIIIFSQYFEKNYICLFLGGYLIGSITEYLISFLVEIFLHVNWWDYSQNILNVNGRVCFLYSIFWGMLTVFLVRIWHPFMEKIINKIKSKVSYKFLKGVIVFWAVFLIFDCGLTCYAQDIFITRMAIEHNIVLQDFRKRRESYERLKENKALWEVVNQCWNDEKMIKTFPNMKVEDRYENIIYFDSLLPTIQPYYKKIFE